MHASFPPAFDERDEAGQQKRADAVGVCSQRRQQYSHTRLPPVSERERGGLLSEAKVSEKKLPGTRSRPAPRRDFKRIVVITEDEEGATGRECRTR